MSSIAYEQGGTQATYSGTPQQMENFLNYYRNKLGNQNKIVKTSQDNFDEERVEWQHEAEKLRFMLERVHQQEQELGLKKTEIAELQKMLSDQRLAVHDERQQYMKLKREHNLMLSKLLITSNVSGMQIKSGKT